MYSSFCQFGFHYFTSLRELQSDSSKDIQVERGVVVAVEDDAARVEDIAAHGWDVGVIADDVAQVPRLWDANPFCQELLVKRTLTYLDGVQLLC